MDNNRSIRLRYILERTIHAGNYPAGMSPKQIAASELKNPTLSRWDIPEEEGVTRSVEVVHPAPIRPRKCVTIGGNNFFVLVAGTSVAPIVAIWYKDGDRGADIVWEDGRWLMSVEHRKSLQDQVPFSLHERDIFTFLHNLHHTKIEELK